MKKYGLVILFVFGCFCSAVAVSRDEIVSTYLHRLAENIHWSHSAEIEKYHFHVVGSDRSAYSTMQNTLKGARLFGKPIYMTYGKNEEVPLNAHLVYVAPSNRNLYEKIFHRVEGRNILLVSDGLSNAHITMINLYENSNNRIQFKINKANIISQNLGVDPDIILIGGSEIDVAELYKETESALRKKESKISGLKAEFEEINREKSLLQGTILTQKTELDLQTKQLEETKREVDARQKELQKQIAKSTTQKLLYEKLKRETLDQETNLDNQLRALRTRAEKLDQQQDEIIKRNEILSEKEGLIKTLDDQIEKQKMEMDAQAEKIKRQHDRVFYLTITVGLGVILVFVVARGNYKKKKINKQLQEAKKSADTANNAKSIFLANMSHEIRTPMNIIIGMTQIIQDTELDSTQSRYIKNISQSTHSLLMIINDILDLSKLGAKKLPVERIPFSIETVLEDVMGLVKVLVNEETVDLRLDLDDGLPAAVEGDPLRLSQILQNLLSNSAKFTERGEIVASARVRPTGEEEIEVEFIVRDTGIGMLMQKAEQLFSPFAQADESISRQYGGTGLGLAICQQLTDLMHGRIWVESTLGEGSEFHLVLPYKVTKEPIHSLEAEAGFQHISIQKAAEKLKGKRILLVEDNELNQEVASALLKKIAVELTIASNGWEAIELVRDREFDLVLMDIQMPGISGYDATREIRSSKKPGIDKLPIIALTAHAFSTAQKESLKSGMNGHLGKPIHIKELCSVLLKWLAPDTENSNSALKPTPAPPKPKEMAPSRLSQIDVEVGMGYMGGDPDFYFDLLEKFYIRSKDSAEDIERSLSEGEREKAGRNAHNIKGLAGMLGAKMAQIAAGELSDAIYSSEEHPVREIETFRETIQMLMVEVKHVLSENGKGDGSESSP